MLSKLHHLSRLLWVDRRAQLPIDKVGVQHADEHLEEGTGYVGGLVACTDGRNGENADQIIDTGSKSFDFSSLLFHLVSLIPQVVAFNYFRNARRSRRSLKNSSGGT